MQFTLQSKTKNCTLYIQCHSRPLWLHASLNIAREQICIQNTPKRWSNNSYRTVIRFIKAYVVNRMSCSHWLKQNCLSSYVERPGLGNVLLIMLRSFIWTIWQTLWKTKSLLSKDSVSFKIVKTYFSNSYKRINAKYDKVHELVTSTKAFSVELVKKFLLAHTGIKMYWKLLDMLINIKLDKSYKILLTILSYSCHVAWFQFVKELVPSFPRHHGIEVQWQDHPVHTAPETLYFYG